VMYKPFAHHNLLKNQEKKHKK